MTDWIDLDPSAPQVMDYIRFNNFFLFNYIIKINAHKIKYQPKNRHLLRQLSLESKQESIIQFISQPIQY
jgi:hypothetical protein